MATGLIERGRSDFEEVYRGSRSQELFREGFRRIDEFVAFNGDTRIGLDTSEQQLEARIAELLGIVQPFLSGFMTWEGSVEDLVVRFQVAIGKASRGKPIALDLLDIEGAGFAIHDIDSAFRREYSIIKAANLKGDKSKAKSLFLGFQIVRDEGENDEHVHVSGGEGYSSLSGPFDLILNDETQYMNPNTGEIVLALPGDKHAIRYGKGGGITMLFGIDGFGPKHAVDGIEPVFSSLTHPRRRKILVP